MKNMCLLKRQYFSWKNYVNHETLIYYLPTVYFNNINCTEMVSVFAVKNELKHCRELFR